MTRGRRDEDRGVTLLYQSSVGRTMRSDLGQGDPPPRGPVRLRMGAKDNLLLATVPGSGNGRSAVAEAPGPSSVSRQRSAGASAAGMGGM